MYHNYWEHENRDGDDTPKCDECDHDALAQSGTRRLCGECLSREGERQDAQYYARYHGSSRPVSEAERHALVLAQMEGRR
jgi:hypothetical protein